MKSSNFRGMQLMLTNANVVHFYINEIASKFSVLKSIEIVMLWVYYTIPFGFSLFRHFMGITFQLFKFHGLA